MKKLIIHAHPYEWSFNHALAHELQKTSHETRIINTATQPAEFYVPIEKKELSENQKSVQWADEIIFVFPIWWMDCPASMKNFIDTTFTRGFAFDYKDNKPLGLLSGKSCRIIATSWASLDPLFKFIFWLVWWKWRVEFCGMKYVWSLICWDVVQKTQEQRQQFMQKALSWIM